jgi:hypothetical protein
VESDEKAIEVHLVTGMELIAAGLSGWGIAKVADAVLDKIVGRGRSNALQTALSIALQEFRDRHPKVHGGLFEQPAFWDALQEEIELLLEAESQPDAKRLAQQIGPLPAVPIDRLERALEDLFRLIRQECRRQPDLIAIEQFRVALDVKDQFEELVDRLGLDPDIEETVTKARVATRADLEKFRSFLGISATDPALGLSLLQEPPTGRHLAFTWDDLLSTLQQATAITLEAEPGGGKTTTLFELAARLLDDATVPIFVPLPEQEANDLNLLDGVARRPAFNEQLTVRHLQALARHGRLILLMDGWNELPSSARSRVRLILESFRRDYPSVGLVLATRPEVASPTLPRSFSLRLDRLTAEQRTVVIQERLGEQAESLCERIERSPNLDEITCVPLYLQALLKIHNEEALPETREGLLRAFVKVHEERPEHRDRLREELFGCHRAYLKELAVVLVADGSTALPEAAARRAVARASRRVRDDGQIAAEPQPQIVLEVLAAHHLLLLYGADEAPSCRFQHHQFQEWYASLQVEALVLRAALGQDPEALAQLRAAVIDIPRWEQALLFAAERLSRTDERGAEAGARLVEWCLEIDPLLAAEIIHRSEENVWMHAAAAVIGFVERWHEPGHVDRALAFMIASGRPEFANPVWGLVAHQDQQVRLEATRCFNHFRVSVLGLDWKIRLAAQGEEVRRDVLSEIAFFGGAEGLEIATGVASDDPSDAIRMAILDAARFRGSHGQIGRLLENAPPSFWPIFGPRAEASDLRDAGSRDLVIQTLHEMVAAAARPIGRLRLLLKLHELGDGTTFEAIFGEVEQLERGEDEDRWAPYYLLKEAAQLDPERTSAALLRRLTAGDTLGSGWDAFISQATQENRQRLTAAILDRAVPAIERETVAKLLGSPEIGQIIVHLLITSDAIAARQRPYPAELGETYHDLQRILQSCQFPALTQAIVEMPPLSNARHAGVLADVLAGYGGHEQRQQRLLLPDGLLRCLRERLHAWINLIQNSVDGRRGQLANIAVTLGRLGQSEDLPLLQELLQADLNRWRSDRDAWNAGGRKEPRPPELNMSYSIQYRRAFEAMPSAGIADALNPYLSHPDFAAEAAFILRHVWLREHGLPEGEEKWSRWPDYSRVREQFAIRQSSDERPPAHPVAAAILDRIEELLPESGEAAVRSILFQLGNAVADMEYGDRLPVILRVVELEGTPRSKRACLAKLAQKGERLDAGLIRAACEAALLERQQEHWQLDENWWMVEGWLELLALSDEPAELLAIIERLPPRQRMRPWSLEHVLRALQYSPAPGAGQVLLRLAELAPGLGSTPAWLEAVVAHDSKAIVEACLTILWNPARAAKVKLHLPSGEAFVAKLARIFSIAGAPRAELLAKLETQLPAPVQRLLASIFVEMADDDEVWSAAPLVLSNAQQPPHHIDEMIERSVTDRVPVEGWAAYEIVPTPAAHLRRRLFEMVLHDRLRDRAALRLLVGIDRLRDQYGRPDDEPRHPWLASGVPWPLLEPRQDARPD